MRPYQLNHRLVRKDLIEPAPLFSRMRSAGAGDVAFHPRIDDIVDLIKLRRTHEEAVRNIHTDGRLAAAGKEAIRLTRMFCRMRIVFNYCPAAAIQLALVCHKVKDQPS